MEKILKALKHQECVAIGSKGLAEKDEQNDKCS